MSRRRAPLLVVALLIVLAAALLAPLAAAQPAAPPLEATIYFVNPPANMTFVPGTPIKLVLVLKNVTNPPTPLLTIDGFSASDFWRQLYFSLEGVGTFGNTSADTKHTFVPFGTCHYRNSAIVPSIQVVPVEILASDFALQFVFDDVTTHFDLSRGGRYTVNARLSFFTYSAGDVINDCNIEFGNRSLLSIGAGNAGGRQQFDIVSNSLQFVIQPADSTPPATTVAPSVAPNAPGWNNADVTLAFNTTDNAGGSGVKSIALNLFGAQPGSQTITGASGSVAITTEGITTAFFNAEDNAGNKEPQQSLTVRIDKTPPVVSPPASVTVAATESGGARGSASAALAALLAGGTATDNLDPKPTRLAAQVNGANADNTTLFPTGTTTVTFRFQDVAGNVGTATATVTVTGGGGGQPAISGSIVGKGFRVGRLALYEIKFTNTGTATAKGVTLKSVTLKTLEGSGVVSYNTALSPRLPLALGDLTPGASRVVLVVLTVPKPVKRFSISEGGEFRDAAGKTQLFSVTQQITLPDRRPGDDD